MQVFMFIEQKLLSDFEIFWAMKNRHEIIMYMANLLLQAHVDIRVWV